MSTQGNENREIDGAVYLGNDPQELERIAMLKKTRNKGMVGIPQTEIVHPEPSQSLER